MDYPQFPMIARVLRRCRQQLTGSARRALIAAKDASIFAHFRRPDRCLETAPDIDYSYSRLWSVRMVAWNCVGLAAILQDRPGISRHSSAINGVICRPLVAANDAAIFAHFRRSGSFLAMDPEIVYPYARIRPGRMVVWIGGGWAAISPGIAERSPAINAPSYLALIAAKWRLEICTFCDPSAVAKCLQEYGVLIRA